MRILPTFDDAPVKPETFIPAPTGLQAVFAEDPQYTEDGKAVTGCTVKMERVLGWLVYRYQEPTDDQDGPGEQLEEIPVTLERWGLNFGRKEYSEFDVEASMEFPQSAFLGFTGETEAGSDWPALGCKVLKPREAHGRQFEREKRIEAARKQRQQRIAKAS